MSAKVFLSTPPGHSVVELPKFDLATIGILPVCNTGTWEAPEVAARYATFADTKPYSAANQALLEAALDKGLDPRCPSILELGSGTGKGTETIRRYVSPSTIITCVDYSEQMTKFAAERWDRSDPNTHFVQGDVSQLDKLGLTSCSHVFSFNALMLFHELPKVLLEINELLPSGGLLVANSTLFQDAIAQEDLGSFVTFTKAVLKEARERGISRNKSRHHQAFMGSSELQSTVERAGFAIEHFTLDKHVLSNEDLLTYAKVPGIFHDLVGPEVPQSVRVDVFGSALSGLPSEMTFARRWFNLVARKP